MISTFNTHKQSSCSLVSLDAREFLPEFVEMFRIELFVLFFPLFQQRHQHCQSLLLNSAMKKSNTTWNTEVWMKMGKKCLASSSGSDPVNFHPITTRDSSRTALLTSTVLDVSTRS